MITTLLHLLRLFPFLCGGHRQLALENLALRQRLAVYKRTAKRPKLGRRDRLFWVWLSRVWATSPSEPSHAFRIRGFAPASRVLHSSDGSTS
jgi:hypothetical protein